MSGETPLWCPSALHPTNAPFVRVLCTSGEVSGHFFISARGTETKSADRSCSVQLLSDREASLLIHTDVPSSYLPADGRQVGEVCRTSPEGSTRMLLLGDTLGFLEFYHLVLKNHKLWVGCSD
ncbi:hypothetical protein LSAT2_017199 [Lamellibrachia satsuma]|nr:hypothetical protein LSAT2_017199 [Lamellibrachia satsuma]